MIRYKFNNNNILNITRDKNNNVDDLMIRGIPIYREKRRSNIYKYFVGSNRTNGWRNGIP